MISSLKKKDSYTIKRFSDAKQQRWNGPITF